MLRRHSTIRSAANFRLKIARATDKNRDLGMTSGDLAADLSLQTIHLPLFEFSLAIWIKRDLEVLAEYFCLLLCIDTTNHK